MLRSLRIYGSERTRTRGIMKLYFVLEVEEGLLFNSLFTQKGSSVYNEFTLYCYVLFSYCCSSHWNCFVDEEKV